MKLNEDEIRKTNRIISDTRRTIVNSIMNDIERYFDDIHIKLDADTLRKIEDAFMESYLKL